MKRRNVNHQLAPMRATSIRFGATGVSPVPSATVDSVANASDLRESVMAKKHPHRKRIKHYDQLCDFHELTFFLAPTGLKHSTACEQAVAHRFNPGSRRLSDSPHERDAAGVFPSQTVSTPCVE